MATQEEQSKKKLKMRENGINWQIIYIYMDLISLWTQIGYKLATNTYQP